MSKGRPDIRDNVDYRRLVRQLQELPTNRLRAFEEFMDEEEKGARMELKERIAQAMARRLAELNLGVKALADKLPNGFWSPIFERFESEGITRPGGGKWRQADRLSQYWKNQEKAIRPLIETLMSSEPKTVKQPGSETARPTIDRDGLNVGRFKMIREEFSERLEQAVTQLRLEMRQIMNEARALEPRKQETGLSPLAPRAGRGIAGERAQFASYVDKVLLDGMKRAAQERRTTLVHVIESAMWFYLGKPRLSFEQESPKGAPEEAE